MLGRLLVFLICLLIITSAFLLILWREYNFLWLIVAYVISFLFYFGADNEELRKIMIKEKDNGDNQKQ